MYAIVEEVKSVLTINKALREGKAVFCSVPDLVERERVHQAKVCPHLVKREVLTVHGWKHPSQVWIETSSETAPGSLPFDEGHQATAAAKGGAGI